MTTSSTAKLNQAIARKFVDHLVDEMSSEIRRLFAVDHFEVKTLVVFSRRRFDGRGGRGADGAYITLALHDIPVSTSLIDRIDSLNCYDEYEFIANDPTVGSFKTYSWFHKVAALIAHEVAHAAQFTLMADCNEVVKQLKMAHHNDVIYTAETDRIRRAHGEDWQRLYAHLRRTFVNGMNNRWRMSVDVVIGEFKQKLEQLQQIGMIRIVGLHWFNDGLTYYKKVRKLRGEYQLYKTWNNGCYTIIRGGRKVRLYCDEKSIATITFTP